MNVTISPLRTNVVVGAADAGDFPIGCELQRLVLDLRVQIFLELRQNVGSPVRRVGGRVHNRVGRIIAVRVGMLRAEDGKVFAQPMPRLLHRAKSKGALWRPIPARPKRNNQLVQRQPSFFIKSDLV